jgi:hypothetical protein
VVILLWSATADRRTAGDRPAKDTRLPV